MALSHARLSHCASSVLKIACLLTLLPFGQLMAQTAYEPTLPLTTDVQSAGYFPTITEDILLRGPNDSRSLGRASRGNVEGPDNQALTASGLFRYYDNEADFYQRNDGFFRPINHVLGTFTRHDSLMLESESLQHVSFSADPYLNIFTRSYNPELAHLKLGLLYFDVLWMGAGVIYSDFKSSSPQRFVNGDDDEDGWIGYVELGVRGMVRLTDSIYFSAVANVIYLPFENKLGLSLGNSGSPGILLRFTYNETIGEWDILFYDEFRGLPGLEVFVDADSPAFDRAGRYSFGFLTDRNNDFYNEDSAIFANTLAFFASRALFDNQWRLIFGLGHVDSWRTFDFADHGTRDFLDLAMQYEGSLIPFAPRFSYGYVSNDGYRSLLHLLQMRLTGRITENLDWGGSVGYGFSTGDTNERERFLWSLALNHNLSRSTRHSLSIGEGYFQNEFVSDTRFARYARYQLDQRITSRFNVGLFAQFSENETSTTALFPTRDRMGFGLSLTYRPLDFTSINAFALYEQKDLGSVFDDSARWLYRVQMTQQLGHRLTGNVFYQYEEFRSDVSQFSEHVCGLSLRRYF